MYKVTSRIILWLLKRFYSTLHKLLPILRPEPMDARITIELNTLLCTFTDHHNRLRRKLPHFRNKGRPQRDCLFGFGQATAITSDLTYKQTSAHCETSTSGKNSCFCEKALSPFLDRQDNGRQNKSLILILSLCVFALYIGGRHRNKSLSQHCCHPGFQEEYNRTWQTSSKCITSCTFFYPFAVNK